MVVMDEQQAMEWVTGRVLKFARELSECKDSNSTHDVFHVMQRIAQGLSGLAESIRDYDETVRYFKAKADE
jgi:hypothetical protein